MKETPIIFSTDMVRAILDGRKTQTRRILKPQPDYGLEPFESYASIEVGCYHPVVIDKNGEQQPGDEIFGAYTDDGKWGWKCPYGQVGDLLWARETWYSTPNTKELLGYVANGNNPHEVPYRVKPSIHMRKCNARIWLEITGIRVERLQEISNSDVLTEGVSPFPNGDTNRYLKAPKLTVGQYNFKELWDSINAKRGYGWETNPWVWVIEFRRIK